MQSRNKNMEDISQLMTIAMGVAQGAKGEAETVFNSWIERWLADHDFVSREAFDDVRGMAQKAGQEDAALRARIEAFGAASKPAPAKKPAAKKPAAKK